MLGTKHHEETVRLEAVSLLPRIIQAFDEPFGDATALPQLVLSEMARRHVTVALSGDGGDELFGGYPRYRRLSRILRWRRLPAPLRRAVSAATALRPSAGKGAAGRLRHGLDGTEAEAYLPGLSLLLPGQILAETSEELAHDWPAGWGRELTGRWGEGGRSGLDAAMAFDLSFYLVDDILAKVDRTSMACSLEVRVPLLDHVFVEKVAALPARTKCAPGEDKHLLRRMAREILPPAAMDRPKHGFTVPLDRWFRGELRDVARERFADSRSMLRDLFPARLPERLLEAHASGESRCGETLWALLILDLWGERNRSARGAPSP
jgi:asparagine synthase (glutamine-hydrolysing)